MLGSALILSQKSVEIVERGDRPAVHKSLLFVVAPIGAIVVDDDDASASAAAAPSDAHT